MLTLTHSVLKHTKGLAMAAAVLATGAAFGQSPTTMPGNLPQPPIGIELNRMTYNDDACTAWFIVYNNRPDFLANLTIEVVMFDIEGIGITRLNLVFENIRVGNGVPLVRLFELAKLPCTNFGKININAVSVCKQGLVNPIDVPLTECLDNIGVLSRVSTTRLDGGKAMGIPVLPQASFAPL